MIPQLSVSGWGRILGTLIVVFAELLSNGLGVFLNVVHELITPLSPSEASVDIY